MEIQTFLLSLRAVFIEGEILYSNKLLLFLESIPKRE